VGRKQRKGEGESGRQREKSKTEIERRDSEREN
jgi:hypothetical protein